MITGQSAATYVVTATDGGTRIYSNVRAHNAYGWSSWAASSNLIGPIPAAVPPVITVLPHLTGQAQAGATLTTTAGTWSGSPDSYVYEWVRCTNPPGCSNLVIIGGQTAASYVVTTADAGASLYSAVQAHNQYGWSGLYASDNAVGPIPPLPGNSTRPHVTGVAQLGATLTTTSGTWTGSPDSYAYQWIRCSDPPGCTHLATIAGQTGTTYTVTAADAGSNVFSAVRAHNASGWSRYYDADNRIGPVPGPPINMVAPHVGGTAVVGATLTTSTGTWNGTPDSFAYSWLRCTTTCIQIAGQAGNTYVVTAADAGSTIYASTRAHNASGWAANWVTSDNGAGPVLAHNVVKPHVSGDALVGATLSATAGEWAGAPDAYAFQWRHCLPAACVPTQIAGATAATYVAGAGDVGQLVYATVAAHNAGGWSASVVADNTIGPIGVVSGGSGGTPPPVQPTVAAPALTRHGTVSTTRKRTTTIVSPAVVVTCPAGGPSCSVVVTAQTRVRSGRRYTTISLARTTLRVNAGATLKIAFPLTAKGAKLLRSRGRLAVKVTLSARAGTRTPVTLVRNITIRRPR